MKQTMTACMSGGLPYRSDHEPVCGECLASNVDDDRGGEAHRGLGDAGQEVPHH